MSRVFQFSLLSFVFLIVSCGGGGGDLVDTKPSPVESSVPSAKVTPSPTPTPTPSSSPSTSPSVDGIALRGKVSGLMGTSVLSLQELSTGRTLKISANGDFNFAEGFDDGEAYEVSILSQPVGQYCNISNIAGTIENEDVLDINVVCLGRLGFDLQMSGFETMDPSLIVAGIRVADFETGIALSGFKTSDFIVSENGQVIRDESFLDVEAIDEDDVVVHTVLVLDISSSIDAVEMENIKVAAKASLFTKDAEGNYTSKLFSDKQSVAIYTFGSEVDLLVDFTSDMEELESAIDTIPNSVLERSNSTNLIGAVETAALRWDVDIDLANIEYGYAVLLTDGEHNYDARQPKNIEHKLHDEFGVRKHIYAIAVGEQTNPESLASLTADEEKVFKVASFDDPDELLSVFNQISVEAHSQTQGLYRVYYATPKRDNFHVAAFALRRNSACTEECKNEVDNEFISGEFFDISPTLFVPVVGGEAQYVISTKEPGREELVYSGNLIGSNDSLLLSPDFRWANTQPNYTFTVAELVGSAPIETERDDGSRVYTFPEGFISAVIQVSVDGTALVANIILTSSGEGVLAVSDTTLEAFVEKYSNGPNIDCNRLSDDKVYVRATLENSIPYYRVIADPQYPSEVCAGFSKDTAGYGYISKSGKYIYSDNSEKGNVKVIEFVSDDYSYDFLTGEHNYPEEPEVNDSMIFEEQDSSLCDPEFIVSPADGRVFYECNGIIYTDDDKPYYQPKGGLGNSRHFEAVLLDGSLLISETVGENIYLIGRDKSETTFKAPFRYADIVTVKSFTDLDTGNNRAWLVISPISKNDYDRWTFDLETKVIANNREFAKLPSKVSRDRYEKPVLDGQGRLYIKADLSGNAVVVRQPIESSGDPSEIIYNEADDPSNRPYIKISNKEQFEFVTGP